MNEKNDATNTESTARQQEFISIWYMSELVRWWEKGLLPARQNLDIEYYCSFQGAYEVACFFTDIPTLVHGPSGCSESFNGTRAYPGDSRKNKPRCWNTGLNHDDIVFGASKKLQKALLKLDRDEKPPLITILTNCCADIIGEDINAAINAVSSDINADVIHIETGGCSGAGFRKGADMALERLFEYVADKQEKVKKSVSPSINLFTKRLSGRPAEIQEVSELERLLEKTGIGVNSVIRLGSSYKDLMQIPHATANATLCNVFGDEPMRLLNNLFDQPYTKTIYPIGLEGTLKWIEEIARITGVDPQKILKDPEVTAYRDKIKRAREKYQGRKAFVWMPGEKGLAMARFAHELGMQPYIFTMSYQAVEAMEGTIKLFLDAGLDLPAVLSGKEIIMRKYADAAPSEKPILFMPRKFWAGELPAVTTNCFGDVTLGLKGIDVLLDLLEKAEKNAGKKDYSLFNRFIESRTEAYGWKLSAPAFEGEEKYYERKQQVLARKKVMK